MRRSVTSTHAFRSAILAAVSALVLASCTTESRDRTDDVSGESIRFEDTGLGIASFGDDFEGAMSSVRPR